MDSLIYKSQKFFEKYERHISSAFLMGGFIFDNLTLQRVDKIFDILIIISYILLAGLGIALLNYYSEYPPRRTFFIWTKDILPFLIQFTFGGLFSVFLVFYSRSASLSSSWPFLVILLTLLVGNEFFRSYYDRITFQVGVYYVAVLSFSILILPVLIKKINAWVFVLSGILSLIFIYFFTRSLFWVVSKRYEKNRVDINRAIAGIFLAVNIFYFTNLIPPIPLAMKHSDIYLSVVREGNDYVVVGEKRKWYEELPVIRTKTIHVREIGALYAFSSIFAPTNLNTSVYHDWQYFDEGSNRWVSTTRINFNISGGRNEGYRVFSRKEGLFAGKWRVNVETERGQVIGRIRFDIEISDDPVEIEAESL